MQRVLLGAFVSSLVLQIHGFEPICPLVFDGRIPPITELGAFDIPTETPWSGLRGRDVKWSSILKFPAVQPSVFDYDLGGKAVEVQINDLSVIRPSGTGAQTGYRRADLVFRENTGVDASTIGVKTFHWSVRQSREHPLNLTHEYMNVFHERKDEKGKQFTFSAGALVGKERVADKRNWKMLDHDNKIVWQAPINFNDWENFAVTLDYARNTMQVYYSKGQDRLQPVTSVLQNHNDNGGLFQIGILKKSIGAKDPVKDGYHPTNMHEGQIYGGVFIEDSANGCVSR